VYLTKLGQDPFGANILHPLAFDP